MNANINTTFTTSVFDQLPAGTGAFIRYSTTDDEAIAFNAMNGSESTVNEAIGEDIYVTDIVITSVDIAPDRNKPDEIVSKPCVNFFTADGMSYSSLSNGIIRATKNLLGAGMIPSGDNVIHLRFSTVATKKGTAHTFRLVRG